MLIGPALTGGKNRDGSEDITGWWQVPRSRATGFAVQRTGGAACRPVVEVIVTPPHGEHGMPATATRPLLIVDGDSFAHRAYHAVPKTVRRAGNKGGGAIVGFANYLLRLYEAETPRAVIVGWDTLDVPNWRARLFPPYQGGREFDDELIDQL
ncbi:MAG TPA: hypothetical protein GYA10_13540, partial [Alphaproteobacteria bacterium]|nr:hypothetical protein [Alphaproteobacteria bacterium]